VSDGSQSTRTGGLRGGNIPSLRCQLSDPVHPERAISIVAILDSAATHSYMTNAAARAAGIKVKCAQDETVSAAGGRSVTQKTGNIKIRLSAKYLDFFIDVPVKCVDSVCRPIAAFDVSPSDIPSRPGLRLTEDFPRPATAVDLLIGIDILTEITPSSSTILKGGKGGKIQVWETYLGPAIGGVVSTEPSTENNDIPRPHELELPELTKALKNFWDWETLGIREGVEVLHSPDEKFAVEHFYKHQRFENGHYTVRLPFHPDRPLPKNNAKSAERQFLSLERSLLRNPERRLLYEEAINKYIDAGHAELVPEAQLQSEPSYWMPHHGVWRSEAASTKLRIVFNGSAPDATGWSLNDAMVPGPALQVDLADVLTRFRKHHVALSSDISKMFLMVGVQEEDRNLIRFYWRSPGDTGPVKVYRFTVLPFGLNSSPFLAIKVVLHHLDSYEPNYPRTVNLLRQSMYVDDFLGGDENEEQALKTRKEIQEIMEAGGFHLAKWLATKPSVVVSIPEADRAPSAPMVIAEKNIELTPDAIPSALGILWDPLQDHFEFQGITELLVHKDKETMRSLCSRAAKVFDPLGLASPVLISAKIMIQQCWKAKLHWDDELPPGIRLEWEEWIEALIQLHYYRVPRALFLPNAKVVEIHAFSDACQWACAAVVYARTISVDGSIQVTLVMSKTKVNPVKTQTIPRLELMGCVLSARLAYKIIQALQIPKEKVILWTDSTTALAWIDKPPTQWKTYVGNRVAQIHEKFESKQFRYVRSIENPADLASRGMTARAMVISDLWRTGPSYLQDEEKNWPQHPDEKIRKKQARETINAEIQESAPYHMYLVDKEAPFLFKLFSEFQFLPAMRILAFVLRYVNKLRKRSSEKLCCVTPVEFKAAHRVWVRAIQQRTLPDEILHLKPDQLIRNSPYRELRPYIDEEGLIRVGGRLDIAILPEETRHPPILPSNDAETRKYIYAMHLSHSHAGTSTLLGLIRMKFWLIGGKREVKSAITCCTCYRQRAKPFSPTMAPLPLSRTTGQVAFLHVGMDFAGPFLLYAERDKSESSGKNSKDVQSKPGKTEKRKIWVLLFTCMASRAVHFEYCFGEDTHSTVDAILRFTSRRGLPQYIYCDNGRSFIKADAQLIKLYEKMDWNRINRLGINVPQRIGFRYSSPFAPHEGGAWERMVQSLKRTLYRILGPKTVTLDEFRTALCRAEAIVNSRPLFQPSGDIRDPAPITPAHLAIGRAIEQVPDHLARDDQKDPISVQWQARQKLVSSFWNSWTNQYLTSLQVTNKWVQSGRTPRVGEVVILKDAHTEKHSWPLAIVREIHPSRRDGVTRIVTVGTGSKGDPGSGKPESTYRRDVRYLAPLEAELPEEEEREETPSPSDA
jgi:hypothetical protein